MAKWSRGGAMQCNIATCGKRSCIDCWNMDADTYSWNYLCDIVEGTLLGRKNNPIQLDAWNHASTNYVGQLRKGGMVEGKFKATQLGIDYYNWNKERTESKRIEQFKRWKQKSSDFHLSSSLSPLLNSLYFEIPMEKIFPGSLKELELRGLIKINNGKEFLRKADFELTSEGKDLIDPLKCIKWTEEVITSLVRSRRISTPPPRPLYSWETPEYIKRRINKENKKIVGVLEFLDKIVKLLNKEEKQVFFLKLLLSPEELVRKKVVELKSK